MTKTKVTASYVAKRSNPIGTHPPIVTSKAPMVPRSVVEKDPLNQVLRKLHEKLKTAPCGKLVFKNKHDGRKHEDEVYTVTMKSRDENFEMNIHGPSQWTDEKDYHLYHIVYEVDPNVGLCILGGEDKDDDGDEIPSSFFSDEDIFDDDDVDEPDVDDYGYWNRLNCQERLETLVSTCIIVTPSDLSYCTTTTTTTTANSK